MTPFLKLCEPGGNAQNITAETETSAVTVSIDANVALLKELEAMRHVLKN